MLIFFIQKNTKVEEKFKKPQSSCWTRTNISHRIQIIINCIIFVDNALITLLLRTKQFYSCFFIPKNLFHSTLFQLLGILKHHNAHKDTHYDRIHDIYWCNTLIITLFLLDFLLFFHLIFTSRSHHTTDLNEVSFSNLYIFKLISSFWLPEPGFHREFRKVAKLERQ